MSFFHIPLKIYTLEHKTFRVRECPGYESRLKESEDIIRICDKYFDAHPHLKIACPKLDIHSVAYNIAVQMCTGGAGGTPAGPPRGGAIVCGDWCTYRAFKEAVSMLKAVPGEIRLLGHGETLLDTNAYISNYYILDLDVDKILTEGDILEIYAETVKDYDLTLKIEIQVEIERI